MMLVFLLRPVAYAGSSVNREFPACYFRALGWADSPGRGGMASESIMTAAWTILGAIYSLREGDFQIHT